jgi:UDP-N-acetylmuramoyl-L-alanyl-D-glutamate--2,6-diaminopimelate ligase
MIEDKSEGAIDLRISGLSLDSRTTKPGDLFFAVPGELTDGRAFINEALQKGAVCVLTTDRLMPMKAKVPVVPFADLKNALGHIAARFFDEPARKLAVIGITGTNGKTSCSHFIAETLSAVGKQCGVIGTLGLGFIGDLKESLTTPDPILLQATLKELYQKGAKAVAIEASSHGLAQGRLAGVEFHTKVFTNLTRDHLDYHQDMANYWAAKKKLFTDYVAQYAVINLDDDYGKKLLAEKGLQQGDKKFFGYTTVTASEIANKNPVDNILSTEALVLNEDGIYARIKTPWGEGELKSTLYGRFNLSNLLATVAVLCLQGISLAAVLKAIPNLKSVPGRMTRLGGKGQPQIVIDYAHTPDALAKILASLRTHCQGKLWCIFGCGGERDRGKRALMASIAEHSSDKVIVTQDNPRTEDPKQILADILSGFKDVTQIKIEPERAQAIADTINLAEAQDVILIAGKGHETYQIIGKEKFPFSDEEEVKKVLKTRSSSVTLTKEA